MVIGSSKNLLWVPILKVIASTFLVISLFIVFSQTANARPAFSAIAVDARTGKILYAQNADSYRYPASLTKMMTLYLLFQDLKARRIKLSTRLRVSAYARSRPPSKIGFRRGQTIAVRDAIRALITKSANDVATAIAENLSGSEAAFARRMTRTARSIGMTRTTFKNASGLPNRAQKTTARDMATLGLRLQRDFPVFYKLFATKRFVYRGRRYGNHNRLLGRVEGVDGIKTGYTRASGFNLTSSVRRGKKRIVAVVMGGRTGGSRNRYMTGLIARMFKFKRLTKSTRIASVAGSPPGYVRRKARTRLARAQKFIPVPRKKPQIPAIMRTAKAGKNQDRINTSAPAVTSSTFKTAVIIDDDSVVKFEEQYRGGKDILRTGKTDMVIHRQGTQGTVKITERILPDTTASIPPKNTHARTWNIQIGAFPSKVSAKDRLATATKQASRNLRGKVAFTMEVEKSGVKLYRARFAGFNRGSARRACKKLSRKGFSCFALAPEG